MYRNIEVKKISFCLYKDRYQRVNIYYTFSESAYMESTVKYNLHSVKQFNDLTVKGTLDLKTGMSGIVKENKGPIV